MAFVNCDYDMEVNMQAGLVNIFPTGIREQIKGMNWQGLEEIRIRLGWPLELVYDNGSQWWEMRGFRMTRDYLDEMLNYITGYSSYAMEEEWKEGYITYAGGHRIGITGHATVEKSAGGSGGYVQGLTDINGLNIRIAHEKKGCAKEIVLLLRKEESIYNTIFFAAPGIGKTTYLRDCVRILSSGDAAFPGMRCCVVDERSEIAACRRGKPQNDLGMRCDVLDACPKALGMKMVLRSMSPQVIVVDELGKEEDFVMLEQMWCSGVKVLGSMHAGSLGELFLHPMFCRYIEKGMIERFVELVRLQDGSRAFRIYDGQGQVLWEK